jgi:hypothetical protein
MLECLLYVPHALDLRCLQPKGYAFSANALYCDLGPMPEPMFLMKFFLFFFFNTFV